MNSRHMIWHVETWQIARCQFQDFTTTRYSNAYLVFLHIQPSIEFLVEWKDHLCSLQFRQDPHAHSTAVQSPSQPSDYWTRFGLSVTGHILKTQRVTSLLAKIFDCRIMTTWMRIHSTHLALKFVHCTEIRTYINVRIYISVPQSHKLSYIKTKHIFITLHFIVMDKNMYLCTPNDLFPSSDTLFSASDRQYL